MLERPGKGCQGAPERHKSGDAEQDTQRGHRGEGRGAPTKRHHDGAKHHRVLGGHPPSSVRREFDYA